MIHNLQIKVIKYNALLTSQKNVSHAIIDYLSSLYAAITSEVHAALQMS